MTHFEMLMTIAIVSFGTVATRFAPFIIFPATKRPSPFIQYLGIMLPSAVMGLLVVYALKDTQLLHYPYGLPEIIATTSVICIHLWKRHSLISIIAGTLIYMFLVQVVFISY